MSLQATSQTQLWTKLNIFEFSFKLGDSCSQGKMIPSACSRCKFSSQLYFRVILQLKGTLILPSPLCSFTWKMGIHEPCHYVVFTVLWNSCMKGFRQNMNTFICECYKLLSQTLHNLEFQLGNKITSLMENCQLSVQLRIRQGLPLGPLLLLR